MIVAIIALTVAPPPAHADNINTDKAKAAALAEQINADATQVQILDEQYDGAQYHLGQVQQQLSAAKQQLQVAQANANRSKAALANEAVIAYMHGGPTSTPTVSSYNGSDDLAVEAGYFQLAVGNQAEVLDQYRVSEAQLRQQQTALGAAENADQSAVAQVSVRRQAVANAAAASQAVLNQVKGQLAQLVAQQQAQIQAQQEAQVKAQLLSQAAQSASSAKSATATATAASAASTSSSHPAPTSGSGGSTTSTTRSATGTPSTSGTGGGTTSTTKPPPAPTSAPIGPIPAANPQAARAIAYAQAQIGKPYQWGGAGPGAFDCSGLTMMAWAAAGVSLPHYSAAQYADTAHVPIADLQPGDLVFFGSDIHHVGLYVGSGEMIDAPYTGAFVRVDSIYWPDLQPFGGRP